MTRSRGSFYAKAGAAFGPTPVVRGLVALLATADHSDVRTGDRRAAACRQGALPSPRGSKRLVRARSRRWPLAADTIQSVLVRADSAFYGSPTIGAAVAGRRAVFMVTPSS